MLTDLTTSVTSISPEQLDALFETTPAGTPSADDLKLGKTDDKVLPDLQPIDLEAIDKQVADTEAGKKDEKKDEKQDDKKDEKVEGTKTDDKKDEKVVIPDATTTKTDSKDDKKEDVTVTKDVKVDPAILKSTVDYLVQKGIFKDFEGRDTLEFTDEIYAELVEAQVNKIVEDRYEVKKSSAGEEGKAILEFLEKGGDPDVIVELFKEKREIAQFDVSTDDSQKELISKYYKDVLGWKPERIKRQLDFLVTQEDALKNEAGDIKDKYDEYFKNQKAELDRQQNLYEQEQVRRQKSFETSIKSAIKDYSADEKVKQRLETSLFRIKTLQDGTRVNDFYLEFAKWQSDPKKYIELAEFILDHENYLKRKEVEAQNKVVDKTFKFVKGNQAVSKNKGSEHTEIEDNDKFSGTNFSVIFK